MKKSEQKTALENSLKSLKFDDKYFIYQCDGRLGNTFAISESSGTSGISNITGFMTYKEMNMFFNGIIAVQNKRITFIN